MPKLYDLSYKWKNPEYHIAFRINKIEQRFFFCINHIFVPSFSINMCWNLVPGIVRCNTRVGALFYLVRAISNWISFFRSSFIIIQALQRVSSINLFIPCCFFLVFPFDSYFAFLKENVFFVWFSVHHHCLTNYYLFAGIAYRNRGWGGFQ